VDVKPYFRFCSYFEGSDNFDIYLRYSGQGLNPLIWDLVLCFVMSHVSIKDNINIAKKGADEEAQERDFGAKDGVFSIIRLRIAFIFVFQ